MAYQEFSGELDGEESSPAFVEFNGELDAPEARRELPAGVEPSKAGAGRGNMTASTYSPPAPTTSPTAKPARQSWEDNADQLMRDTAAPAAKKTSVLEGVDLQPGKPWSFREASENRRRIDDMPIQLGRSYAGPVDAGTDIGMDIGGAVKNPVGRGIIAGVTGLGKVLPGAVRAAADFAGADGVADFAGRAASTGDQITAPLQPKGGNEKLAFDIANSITQTAPTMMAGLVGGPAMKILFAQSAAQEYTDGRTAGLDGARAAARAGVMASAEVIGERFGFAEQMKIFKGLASRLPADELAPVFARQIMKEIPGEQLTTLMQFLGDKAGPGALNPEATLSDYLSQAGETLKVTIGQSAVMGGGPMVINKLREGLPKPIDRTPQIERLRKSGDEVAAAHIEKKHNQEQAAYASHGEAQTLADFGPEVQDRYKAIRSTGAKTGEAVTKTASQWGFAQAAQMAGLPPKAQEAITATLETMPPEKAAEFVQKAVTGLVNQGMGQPFQGMDQIALTIEQQRDRMLDSVLSVLDNPEVSPDAPQDTADASAGQAIDSGASTSLAGEQGSIGANGIAEPSFPDGQPEPSAALSPDWTQFPENTGTLNVPRAEMPQIKTTHRGPLVNFMNARGVTSEQVEVDPSSLKPTQSEFSQEKVDRATESNSDRSIIISSDDHIIDGHHQAIAKLQNGEPVRAIRLNAPASELLPLVKEFPSATVDPSSNVQDAPAPAAGIQEAAPDQARTDGAGNAATASGVPSEAGAAGVEADGVAPRRNDDTAPVSSRDGQMRLANRGGRIATLKLLNSQLRKIAPNEAWADSAIEDATDSGLESLQDSISSALVAAQRGEGQSAESKKSALRTELEELSGAELRDIFDRMGLAGSRMTATERVNALMAEDEAEVRAAMASPKPESPDAGRAGDVQADGVKEVVRIKDKFNRTHRVFKDDLDSNKDRIPTVRWGGDVVSGEEIPRSIIKQDGEVMVKPSELGHPVERAQTARPAVAAPAAPVATPMVLQNRDRSTAASISQMNSIAAKPDYLRTGQSRTMDQGAPVVFGDAPAASIKGRTETVADGRGDRIETQYMAVEADDLITSHFADGTTNTDYASGKPGKLRAVAGNGRAAGLIEGYNRQTIGAYRSEFEQDAQALGIDPAAIRAMRKPVLVRVMVEADVSADIGDRSNVGAGARMSPVEEAANDGRRIDLGGLQFQDSGDPSPDAVRGFVQSMPESERGNMLNSDGTPTRQAVDRLMAAVFKSAYGDDSLVQLYAQATDPEARIVMSALAQAAGPMAQLANSGEFDVRGYVAEAAGMAVNATRRGLKLADMVRNVDLDTSPETYAIAEFMAENSRSAKSMGAGLRNLAQSALEQIGISADNALQAGMFGEQPTLSRTQLLNLLKDGDGNQAIDARQGGVGVDAQLAQQQGANSPAESAGPQSSEQDGQRSSRSNEQKVAPAAAPALELVAPSRDEVIAQQDRIEQSGEKDAQDQIRRESEIGDGAFMAGFTEDGRQDNTGSLFDAPAQQEPSAESEDGITIKDGKGLIKGKFLAELDGNDVLFQRQQTTKRGLSKPEVQKAIASVTGQWKNGPKITIVESTADLPMDAPSDVQGVYVNGSVYLVAENLDNKAQALNALAHEAIAHHGLRELLGKDDFKKLMNNITLAVKTGNKPLNAIKAEVRKAYVDGKGNFNLSALQEADEIVAKVVEKSIDADGNFRPGFGFVKSVYAKIADFLRSIGFTVKFTNAELQGLLVAAQKNLEAGKRTEGARSLMEPVFSATEDRQSALALEALSQMDDLFALPKSNKTDLQGIADDNLEGILIRETKFTRLPETMFTLTMPDGTVARLTVRKSTPTSVYGTKELEDGGYEWITGRRGENMDAIEDGTEDLWIDVSNLKEKQHGATVYNIAATFAHNTGRIFIGDPNGLSKVALRRRTEQMLSSALKFGTTDHLSPHQYQIDGDASEGVPGLRWVHGDSVGNIERMIDVTLKSLENALPNLGNIRYDLASGNFVGKTTGRPIPLRVLAERARDSRRGAQSALEKGQAGWRTVARAALLRDLRAASRAGRVGDDGGPILALLRGQAQRLRDSETGSGPRPANQRIFYSRSATQSAAILTPGITAPTAAPTTTAAQPNLPNITQVQAMPVPLPEETKARASQRKFQDQFNRFTVIRNWAEENGMNLSQLSNVWKFEERMHGRIATRLEDFREDRVKPLIQKIQKAGFNMGQVGEFLHAQHAAERNKQILTIDPTNPSGSGMTDAAAAAILAQATPKLKALANEFQAITTDTRQIMLDAGIITPEMAQAWDNTYKNYVPLKGGDEDTQPTGTGKGLSVKATNKRAMGHGERSEHIIENIMRDHERAVMLAEKNLVGQSLLAMAIEMGRDDIAAVGQPERRKVLKNATNYEVVHPTGATIGTFDTQQGANAFIVAQQQTGLTTRAVKGDPMVAYSASPMLAANEVQVYARGHTIRIQLNDPLLARAYTKQGVEALSTMMRVNQQVNAFLSKAYTGYNPEFFFKNVLRDFTSGLINMTGQEGITFAAKSATRYPRAFAQMLKYSYTGKASPSIRLYREHGGSTGAAYLSDIERIGSDIQASYDEYKGALKLTAEGRPVAAANVAAKKLVKKLVSFMEHLNAAGENAMRLAVFDTMRNEPGRNVHDAASLAKNATVNFNRKGEAGAQANALYLFFNAGMQGSAATLDALFNSKNKHQAQALAGALGLIAYSLAALQFGGDDEEDKKAWAKIPDYVKDRNLVIRTGKDTYITLSIPYGYGYFFTLGNAIFDLQRGGDKEKIALKMTSGLLEQFGPAINPIGGDELDSKGLIEMIPGYFGGELMRNTARMITNRSSMGSQITPDATFDAGKPDNQRMFRSSKGTAYEKVAVGVNELTGGTKSQAGWADVSPETVKFWTQTITGGTGKFVVDTATATTLMAASLGEDDADQKNALLPELRELPIVRTLVRKEDIRDARQAYWDTARKVMEAQADFKRANSMADGEGLMSVATEQAYLIRLAKTVEAANEKIKAQRDLMDKINATEAYSRGEKRMLSREIEKQEAAIYDAMIEVFDEAKKSKP